MLTLKRAGLGVFEIYYLKIFANEYFTDFAIFFISSRFPVSGFFEITSEIPSKFPPGVPYGIPEEYSPPWFRSWALKASAGFCFFCPY